MHRPQDSNARALPNQYWDLYDYQRHIPDSDIVMSDDGRERLVFRPPGHSKDDRSASLMIAPNAPGGFLVKTFSTRDNVFAIRDYVRQCCGLPLNIPLPLLDGTPYHSTRWVGGKRQERPARPPARAVEADRAPPLWRPPAPWLRLWETAWENIEQTPGRHYFERRKLWPLPTGSDGEVIRFHPYCPFGRDRHMAVLALIRNIETDEPQGVLRIAITRDGRKARGPKDSKWTLGRQKGGAIKFGRLEGATAMCVAEGLENCLSIPVLEPDAADGPCWALLGSEGLAAFPVLAGVYTLFLGLDADAAGVSAADQLSERWAAADLHCSIEIITPEPPHTDLNDALIYRRAEQ